jgi:hypothetical protein
MCVGIMLLNGCATSGVRLESQPDGADVQFVRLGAPPVVLGKTPLSIEASALRDADGGAHLMVTKDGFLPESILVPHTGLPASTRMNFALKQIVTSKQCEQADESLSDIARGVAETQSQTSKKNFSDAERTLQGLISRYPKVSVLYDLKGNLHYLQKDLTRALEAYQRSIEIRPGNFETLRMIEKLGGIKGVPTTLPATTGSGG